jgi:tetratricopeptide (TPR) repeat protein
VVRAYQQAAVTALQPWDGYVAQYLGDGLMVYFGWPTAHEDAAVRAVHASLALLAALEPLNATQLAPRYGVRVQVRLGVHTGMAVIGEIGGGDRHEQLAMGETPNIAARLQGLADPDTVALSAVTARLVQRRFALETLGTHQLKGVTEPMQVFRVLGVPDTTDEEEAATPGRAVFLVGRDEELGLLHRRWEQSKAGLGQAVLIRGEAGIGKSSLVETLRARVRREGFTRVAVRCSPYHTNSALYPVMEHVQRVLQWQRDDPPAAKLAKLERTLRTYRLPLEDVVPLLAALLSVPLPEGRYPALRLTPQQQKQQTQDALVAWMLEEAECQPVLVVWEDLHWADPSTLEYLGLLLEQSPTAAMLNLLTFRPEFVPPWPSRSHMTPLTLNRLERPQVEALIRHLAGGKALPAEVVAYIVARTDGVPLFVEELTKMLLESDLLHQETERYTLTGPLSAVAIPTTLQDSLMARLDRLPMIREVAQLGAVLGREFAYEMLRALAGVEDTLLQERLAQLVDTELLYQRGRPPRAKYIFKHALVQDAAYASLLKSTRQQYHQQVAQMLEAHFPDTVETEPELVAHHYRRSGNAAKAVEYLSLAGQQAARHSAHAEAINHLTTALELLKTLPDTTARARQELLLHLSLGASLMATKGYAAADVDHTYTRAQELCLHVGEPLQVAQALYGRWVFYDVRGHHTAALALGEQFLPVAQSQQDATLSLVVHAVLTETLLFRGEFTRAQAHCDQARAFYDAGPHRDLAYQMGQDPGLLALGDAAKILWYRGYPDQALERVRHCLALAQALEHPMSLSEALCAVAHVHLFRREGQEAQAYAEAVQTLTHKHGIAWWLDVGIGLQGWARVECAARSGAQEQREAGLVQLREGLAAMRAAEAELWVPLLLGAVAQGYAQGSQAQDGLRVIAEALAMVEKNEERWTEAELYRLKGELRRQQSETRLGHGQDQSEAPSLQPRPPSPQAEAEACFLKAIDIARQQQAKSWELRASISLARLWQSQDKHHEAHSMLSEMYHWFTEGFDTKDLQEAKALLEELGRWSSE